MGTNFYAKIVERGPDDEGLHIGKRSAGWDFLFRAHPDLGIKDCDTWHRYLSRSDVRIVTEDGVECSLGEFWPDATRRPADSGARITETHAAHWRTDRTWRGSLLAKHEWTDPHGHPFADYEFC